jgi:hypothetical protein
MSIGDFFNDTNSLSALNVQNISTDTVTVGNTVPLQGFNSVLITCQSGDVISGTATPSLEHSDDGENFIPVESDFILSETTSYIDISNKVVRFSYLGTKNFIRIIVTTTDGANLDISATVNVNSPRSNILIPRFPLVDVEVITPPPFESSLVKWLDSSVSSSVSVPFGQFPEWKDPRDYGFKVIQGTSSLQFTHGAVTQNGLPVMSCAGDWMGESAGITVSNNNITIYMVVRNINTSTTYGLWDLYEVSGGNKGLVGFNNASGNVYTCRDDTGFTATVSSGNANNWNVIATVRTTNTIQSFMNNGAGALNFISGPITRNMNYLTIGKSRALGLTPLTGYIAEFLVYDVVLNNSQRTQVNDFLKTKWAVP